MKHVLLLPVFLFFVCSLSARDIYVVSVGICDYKYVNDLKNTERDAKNMAKLYLTHTKHVKTLLGSKATHDNILSALKTYFASASEDDIVVFFFSGHGSKNGLCAYDTQSSSTEVTYLEVQEALRSCKAKNKQLFIDACFSGGLRSDQAQESKTESARMPMSNTEGVMLFLSSRSNEVSKENLWANNGFFTQYLLKGMKGGADADGDKIVTARELFVFVSSKVSERTNQQQNPVMWGKFNDDMHIMNWNRKK